MSQSTGLGVANCLVALLSADEATRQRAEAFLRHTERECLSALVQELCAVAAADGVAAHLRQLACILLKNLVRVHWHSAAPRFVPPLLSADDKLVVKQTTTQMLGTKDTKLRTAAALCVAAVVAFEWPAAWPSAIGDLTACLRLPDRAWAMGALRVLDVLLAAPENLAAKAFPLELLFPELLRVFVSTDQHDTGTRQMAVTVFLQCMQWLALRAPDLPHEAVSNFISKHVPSWVLAFAAALTPHKPQQQQQQLQQQQQQQQQQHHQNHLQVVVTREEVEVRSVVAEALGVLFAAFGTHMKPYVQQMVPHLWSCLAQTCALYEDRTARGSTDDATVAALARLCSTLFECCGGLVARQAYRAALVPLRSRLLGAAVRALQLTPEQAERWRDDPDACIDEDGDDGDVEAAGVRLAARQFLETAAESYSDGAWALLEAAGACLAESNELCSREQAAATTGRGGDGRKGAWWRLREAALHAVCLDAPFVRAAPQPEAEKALAEVRTLLSILMAVDISRFKPLLQAPAPQATDADSSSSSSSNNARAAAAAATEAAQVPAFAGFLAARALCCAASYSGAVPAGEVLPFFHVAALLLQRNVDAVTLVGACRAIAQFCPSVPSTAAAPYMPGVLLALCARIQHAESDASLALFLGALSACSAACPDALGLYEQVVTARLLDAWTRCACDAPGSASRSSLAAGDVAAVLKQVACAPKCFEGLVARVLPAVTQVLERGAACASLLPSALDVLDGVLEHLSAAGEAAAATPAERERLAAAARPCFLALVRSVCGGPQPCECELAFTCFRRATLLFAPLLPSWPECVAAVPPMLEKLSDSRDVGEDASLLLAQLFTYTVELVLAHTDPLPAPMEAALLSLLRRIVSTREPANQAVLLTVLASLAVARPAWLLAFVHRSGDSAVVYVMERWLTLHPLLRAFGHYQVKLSVVGLVSLLLVRSKVLEALSVPPQQQQQQKAAVPIPVGIMTVVCQEYKRCDWESTLSQVPTGSDQPQEQQHQQQQQTEQPPEQAPEQQQQQQQQQREQTPRPVTPSTHDERDDYRNDDDVDYGFASAEEEGAVDDEVGGDEELDDDDEDDDCTEEEEAEDLDLPFVQSRPLFRVDLKQYLENAMRAAAEHGFTDFFTGLYWQLPPEEQPTFNTLWARATRSKRP